MKIRHAAILLALLSAEARAQQDSAAPSLSLPPGRPADDQPQRQGPELDVFHPEVATPPAPAPTVAPTIAPQAAPTPAPNAASNATAPAPARAAREPVRNATTPATPSETTAPAATTEPEAPPLVAASPPTEPPAPPVEQPQPAPLPETAATPATQDHKLWLWIIGGLALVGGLALLAWRRRKSEPQPVIPVDAAPAVPPKPPVAPLAPPPAPPVAIASQRARLKLSLDILTARLGLAGLTVGFRLTLTNEGEEAAQDAGIRALMASADAGPAEALQQFYGGAIGHPFANGLAIEPGASLAVAGEITLPPESARPIEVGTRRLLIPLIAFDVHYRWREEGMPGVGRTGGAFIVGQEQEPPAQRLAPFRLDLGPRQYRRPGARATGFAPEA